MDGNPFQYCCLGSNLIAIGNKYDTDKHFVSGVIKIQKKEEHLLTHNEARVCARLLKHPVASAVAANHEEEEEDSAAVTNTAGPSSFKERMEEQKRKQKAAEEGKSKYVNCDFILGSASELERYGALAVLL